MRCHSWPGVVIRRGDAEKDVRVELGGQDHLIPGIEMPEDFADGAVIQELLASRYERSTLLFELEPRRGGPWIRPERIDLGYPERADDIDGIQTGETHLLCESKADLLDLGPFQWPLATSECAEALRQGRFIGDFDRNARRAEGGQTLDDLEELALLAFAEHVIDDHVEHVSGRIRQVERSDRHDRDLALDLLCHGVIM